MTGRSATIGDMLRRRPPLPARLLAAVALLLPAGLLPAGLLLAPPAAAEVRDVRITQDGPAPAALRLAPGDVLRFVNTDTFVHRVVSSGPGWEFDTGALLPLTRYAVAAPLRRPGTYAYRGAGLDTFTGVVLVPDASGRVPPAVSSGATPSPSPLPVPATTAPVPAGSRVPAVADSRSSARAVGSRGLVSPPGARRYGLPVALAVVLLAGAGSLLGRLLLAEAGRPQA